MTETKLLFVEGRVLCRSCYTRRLREESRPSGGALIGGGSRAQRSWASNFGATPSFFSRLLGRQNKVAIPTAEQLTAAGHGCEDCA